MLDNQCQSLQRDLLYSYKNWKYCYDFPSIGHLSSTCNIGLSKILKTDNYFRELMLNPIPHGGVGWQGGFHPPPPPPSGFSKISQFAKVFFFPNYLVN